MKLTKLLIAAGVALSALSAQAQNLVQNGSFESLTVANPVVNYVKAVAGSSIINGWTVGGTSVDVINGRFGAISGNSIDMLGTPGPGSLSQIVNTVVGQAYTISFDLSYNVGVFRDILFSLNDGTAMTFSATSNTSPFANVTYNYTANSDQTKLMFASTGGATYSGVVLDNVSMVTAVPEVETYAMMLAGLGLMGTIARRRKAKAA